MMTKTNRATKARRTIPEIPYAPQTWSPQQLACHRAATMEEAFRAASSLAGGWYGRAVTIDYQIAENNNERYMLRPSEIAPLDGWTPCYTVTAHAA